MKSRRQFLFLLWAIPLIQWVSGCATLQPIDRIDLHRQIYEQWPLETRQMVLDGLVVASMTPEMVYLAWGRPNRIVEHAIGPVWIYEDHTEDNRRIVRRFAVFQDGIVVTAQILKR